MRRLYILLVILLAFSLQSKAKSTEWTGSTSTAWSISSNWSNGVPANGDAVAINVSKTFTVARSPVLDVNISLASLTFGVSNAAANLTINTGITLTVTGDITVQYSSGTNASSAIGISGSTGSAIKCNGSFYVGNSTQQPTPFAILGLGYQINNTNTITVTIDLQNFTVDQNLALSSTSSATANIGGNTSINVNSSILNINSGQLTVSGNISTVNTGGHTGYPGFTYSLLNIVPLTTFSAVTPQAQLIVNPTGDASTNATTLSIGGTVTVLSGDVIDFYGPGSATCTTVYAGNASSTTQTIYSTSQTGLDSSPALYQNLTLGGASPKSVQSGNITIAGDWTSSGAYIDAQTNANTISFQGTSQSLTDNGSHGGSGVIFSNVIFQGSGTKTISSGNFAIGSTGVLTMAGTASLTTNGLLTLMSNSSGTATVATIPQGTSINGLVKSQRFIKGSSTDLSKRGYRLLSSPVYTYNNGGVNYFDLKYLLDSAYVSGAAGGGFNVSTTNPTLYLFREDISASDATFTSGNWKGIAMINNTNAYDIGTQKRLTQANIADTTINLPVGNGVLFFFRGNKSDNSTQTGSKFALPFDYPEDVVFTQTGYLNTGTIAVHQWYGGSTNFSFTSASNVANSSVQGFAFVGNPYASTINFEKFNRNGSNSPIYGTGFPAATVTPNKIWVFNSSSKQYDTYMQTGTVSSVADTTTTIRPSGCAYTGDASNMIASGQGFFMRATQTGQGMLFRENSKINTQPASANINRIMDVPVLNNPLAFSSMAPNVKADPKISAVLGLRLAKDSINTDDAVIVFNNQSPFNYTNEDAEDLNGNGALVSLSIISSDDVALAIKLQKMPRSDSHATRLLVDATASGLYHLRLRNLDNLPPAYDVWLIDSFMKDSLDLKHNSNYDFTINKNNAATYGRNRFSIVVRLNPAAMMHTLSVVANKITAGAQVSWKTENEGNDYTFSVEKSTDGKTFTQIGQVSSNGSGGYAYIDATPAKGMNYYKVKFEDMVLNTVSYSNILSLNYADVATAIVAGNVSVYPNPATNAVNIKMSSTGDNGNSYNITISNSTGHIIKQVKSNSPTWQTDVTQLLPGTYMVQVIKLSDNKLQGEGKFVKL